MKMFRAEDLRGFTKALFMEEVFDSFLVTDAEFRTFCTWSVNARSERAWYSDEELEEERIEEFSTWKKLRPMCFSLIRGQRTPLSFRITLKLPPSETERFLNEEGSGAADAEASGFYMNLRFEDSALSVISIASMNRFPPDKAAEAAWDKKVPSFLKEKGLVISESE